VTESYGHANRKSESADKVWMEGDTYEWVDSDQIERLDGRHVRWIIYFKRYAYHRKAVEASVEDGCYQGLG